MGIQSNDVFSEQLKAALKSENPDEVVKAFSQFQEGIHDEVMLKFEELKGCNDSVVLASRGIRQLTSEEKNFYNGIINASKVDNPKNEFDGLSDLQKALPQTILSSVMDDMKTAFPLLAHVNFVPTATLTKIIVNKKGKQLATWNALNSAFTTELQGAIGEITLTKKKLTAYVIIAKDMLEAGPEWIDAYIRAILVEANGYGAEKSIVTGTGKDEPIGMDRDVSDNVSVTAGVYPQKKAFILEDFSPIHYDALVAKLTEAPEGKPRVVPSVIFIVTPKDYLTRVLPATTVKRPDGTYALDCFPYPTTVIQSTEMTEGQAIIGIDKVYFFAMGPGANGGKIEYDDSVKYIEDQRVYTTKMYGDGRALDNNQFFLVDISSVKAFIETVTTISDVLGSLTVTSAAGTNLGDTKITIAEAQIDGYSYKYKVMDSAKMPTINQVLTTGWTDWDGSADITAATGKIIVVAEVDQGNQCKKVGSATVTAKAA